MRLVEGNYNSRKTGESELELLRLKYKNAFFKTVLSHITIVSIKIRAF